MRVLTAVVRPPSDFLLALVSELIHRGFVRAQAVGPDGLNLAVALECILQEPQSCVFATGTNEAAFEDLALLIDCSPEVIHLTV